MDVEGIDKDEVAVPHALLTMLSHLCVAAIFDKEEWTLDVVTFALETLVGLDVEANEVSGVG